jgi:hypothetical protein
MPSKVWPENLKLRDKLRDLSVGGKMVLNRILRNEC